MNEFNPQSNYPGMTAHKQLSLDCIDWVSLSVNKLEKMSRSDVSFGISMHLINHFCGLQTTAGKKQWLVFLLLFSQH